MASNSGIGRRLSGLAVLLAPLAIGCKDDPSPSPRTIELTEAEQELGRALCERAFDCDCERDYYPFVEDCMLDVQAFVQQLRQRSGTYDPLCMGRLVHRLDELGCDASLDQLELCDMLSGPQTFGGPCMKNDRWTSECGLGLTCAFEYGCVEQGSDEASPGIGEQCDPIALPCDAEGYCEFTTCRPFDRLGQECLEGSCEEGTFCGPEDRADPASPMRCQALVADGQACFGHRECESGRCPNGFCAASDPAICSMRVPWL